MAENSTPNKLLISLYGGGGIGLLIGVLMGLALSPTVGVIISALAGALAVLLGLNEKHFGDAKAIRIGSFGFACVLGVFLGMIVRTNSYLTPSIKQQFDEYTEVGYSGNQAREFIAMERFGATIDEAGKIEGGDPSLAQTRATVGLFSSETAESDCDLLDALNAEQDLAHVQQQFEITGPFWARLVSEVERQVAERHQKQALMALRDVVCENIVIADEGMCRKLAQIAANGNIDSVESVGGGWDGAVSLIRSGVDESEQGTVISILIKAACDAKE